MREKLELIELKHRILCNYPTQHSVTEALSMVSITTVTNPNFFQQQIDHDDKQVQKHLNDSITKAIINNEKKISQWHCLFQQQQEQLSSPMLTSSMIDIIHRRQKLFEQKLNCTLQFHLNYYFRQHFGEQSDDFNLPKISFSPTIIVHASMHLFSKKDLQLLSRGPTYVPPYQLIEKNDIEKNYKRLQHDLNLVFVQHEVNTVQSMNLQRRIKHLYTEVFSKPTISKSIYERALYEKQIIEKIRNDLKKFNLILRRTADQQNVFYLGDRKSFEQLCNEFMLKMDLFEIHTSINNENIRATLDYLTEEVKSMNYAFENIFTDILKYKEQLKKISVLIGKVKLPYLYFLPDLSKQPLLNVKPLIMTSKNSPTYALGRFLDQILRHAVDIHQQGRIYRNGSYFLREFHDYIQRSQRFSTTTKFVTITIGNFYHLVPHNLMINALSDFFLNYYYLPRIENIHHTKILQLTKLFLYNNRFYYDGKIYRLNKGGPTTSRFTETLANIYLLGMENNCLINHRSMQNEFYGRYQNQIFFTWNQSLNELEEILHQMKLQYNHLDFHISIEKQLTFLDIYLENRHGFLYSRVHHEQNRQRYTLPYTSNENSIRIHSHWLRSSLIRAVRYCTAVEDFHYERIYLEMSYLANGYSYEFIKKHLQHFFLQFGAKEFQQFVLDQGLYEKFRHRLFNFMSEQRQHIQKKQESFKKNRRFHLSYIYDNISSKSKFNKQLREILSDSIKIKNTTFENSKLQLDITTKHQYSLNALLSHQRPSHPILNKMI
ncbi:unnamed protein product [Rotaria sp. Silwood2]|nr:unnamed protein product [Rotaria sp. Silwood2]